ncbi:MAG: PEP-CTERM sorting domain-containing protein [Pyrinomonadaceae bacterium]
MKNFATMLKPFALSIALLVLIGTAFAPSALAGPVAVTPLPTVPAVTTSVTPVTTTYVANDISLLGSFNTFVSNASFNGNARTAVVRNAGGTLDFYYQFTNNASSASAISRLSMFNFAGFTTSVAQIQDGTSISIAPGLFVMGTAGDGVADLATRDALPGETVGFNFTPPPNLRPGSFSFVFVIRTNATNFTTGNLGVINGITENAPAFAPAGAPIPEPASMILLGTGLAGIAAGIRKRRDAARS